MKEDKPFWVQVEVESEAAGAKILEAMIACEDIRQWAYQEMRKRWDVTTGAAKSSDLLTGLTLYIHEQHLDIQHYSAVVALNQAVTLFNSGLFRHRETTGIGEQVTVIEMPTLSAPSPFYHQLTVQSRAVWSRYLAHYGRISTAYGGIYLMGEWVETLRAQAESVGIHERLLSYLWHSATLEWLDEGDWRLCFNAHMPESMVGRKRHKEGVRRNGNRLV